MATSAIQVWLNSRLMTRQANGRVITRSTPPPATMLGPGDVTFSCKELDTVSCFRWTSEPTRNRVGGLLAQHPHYTQNVFRQARWCWNRATTHKMELMRVPDQNGCFPDACCPVPALAE